jgi:MYXO-CTERM domain-containing protein
MCWETGTPGETTSSFPGSGKAKMLKSYDELVPGDAFDAPGHHAILFVGWNDDSHSNACVIEQESTALGMQFHLRSTSSLKGEFKPMRAAKFANDTDFNPNGNSVSTGDDDDSTSTPSPSLAGDDDDDNSSSTPSPSNPPKRKSPPPAPSVMTDPSDSSPTIPDFTPPPAPACVPLSAIEACLAEGAQCGVVSDGCDGTVSCDRVPALGCSSGQTCTLNQCGAAACTPKAASVLCQEAKVSRGVECGSVPDGCGGSVDCNSVPSFGCNGGTCGSGNKCQKAAASTDAQKPADPPQDPTSTQLTPETGPGDPGDDGADKGTTPGSSPPPAKAPAKGGCSTAGGSGSGSAPPALLAMIVASVLLRRRRRDAVN